MSPFLFLHGVLIRLFICDDALQISSRKPLCELNMFWVLTTTESRANIKMHLRLLSVLR